MNRHSTTLDEIDAVAAEWIARRDAGLEPHEQAELDRWCAASVLHAEALARFERTWTALGRPRRTGARSEFAQELGAVARRRRRRVAVGVTVTAAVALAVGAAWWSPPASTTAGPAVVHTRTIVHEPARETLPDGTVVGRAAGAEFTVEFTAATRRVTLQRGEVHFSVEKDPGRPFVVVAGGVEVRAVGTAFSVQLGRAQVEVLVTEGRVAVTAQGEAESAAGGGSNQRQPGEDPTGRSLTPVYIDAGKSLVVEVALQPVAAPEVQSVAPAQIAERLAWLNPRVEFSGAPISEVVAVLNRYNATKFTLGDAALASVPLSGLFRADDPETFTRLLETGFGIRSERRGDEIVLRKAR
jgi:transmembrane sensor